MTVDQPSMPARSGLRSFARTAYLVVVWVFVACLVVQFFLAGLGVFAGYQNFLTHRDFGYLFGLLVLPVVIFAALARLPRRFILLSLLILVLFAMQSVLILFRTDAPWVAALHPLNGVLILLIAIWLGIEARRFVPLPLGTASAEQEGAG
jgi:mercuric ion transport protein